MRHLVLTVLAEDQPGIVEQIAKIILSHKGSWVEGKMNRLAGKFAGILLVEVTESRCQPLQAALVALDIQGIKITVDQTNALSLPYKKDVWIEIIANDRPGIIGEISTLLATKGINLESLETFCESAPMSAGVMFKARASVQLPKNISERYLMGLLEGLSDDLMVEIV
ncbi:MAG TPA: ACT domain-containing protein [Porticoccaceae bacterium]|nr:ACT domain-containing protein [Porticoccaceae bacterium]HIK79554.1 ACT domain-containing protein [Porticoccaceae bacterium]